MKFHKNITGGPVTLPTAAVKLCGLEAGGKAELHALEGAAVLMKASMNAMELIHALDSLHQLTVDLAVHLIKVCGPCDGCGGECPFGDFSYEEITLPDDLREEAGIPETFCSYHKTMLGAALTGVMPAPLLIANTPLACDANQLSFRQLAGHYQVWTHGQGVAAGMSWAAQLGVALGVTPPEVVGQIRTTVEKFGLPIDIPCPWETMVEAVGLDKKRSGDSITLILLARLGRAVPHRMKKDELLALLEPMCGR